MWPIYWSMGQNVIAILSWWFRFWGSILKGNSFDVKTHKNLERHRNLKLTKMDWKWLPKFFLFQSWCNEKPKEHDECRKWGQQAGGKMKKDHSKVGQANNG